ncbi:barstar family protein [Streptomyces sp. NPDC015125]|uniref:barstar family protein n=1 Tax=Streptomyces sp. NPDC015125 TaxID=3364938 RepID=UPI0036FD6CAC
MNLEPGLTVIRPDGVDEVIKAAAAEGRPLYQFSTDDQAGSEALFDAVRGALPLDPPVVGSSSWDALSDSLWEGIHSKNHGRVAILWTDATTFADESPEDYRMAIAILRDVAESLSDETATVGRPTDVCIYVGRSDKPIR